jgi:enterochelin esterase family protein
VPHGSVQINFYESKALGMPRMFYVYTPPGYETSKQKYPVLYLLHGGSQIESSWTWTGRANVILDNMLADGKIKPMVVVMPYGHVPRQMAPVQPGGGPAESGSGIEKDILTGVKPLVESKYRVLTDRKYRAIAGLSMGGGQSMSIALHNLDLFSHVAVFSGVTPYVDEMKKMDPAVLNQKLKVIWIGCGTEDSLFNDDKAVADWMTQKNVRHTFNPSGGGHSWPNWQVYLSKYLPLLFRD